MHGLSSSPPSYVQVSHSSILSTNILHYNTESFILISYFIFEGQQQQAADSGKGGIQYVFICRLSNKINKSKQTIYLEVKCENWSIRVVQDLIYSSASTCQHNWPKTSTVCFSNDLKRLAGCRRLFSYSGIQTQVYVGHSILAASQDLKGKRDS